MKWQMRIINTRNYFGRRLFGFWRFNQLYFASASDSPQILDFYHKQYKYILVDEFQDTDLSQYQLVKLMAHPQNNITVVGDDDQSIYKFRGASISNILKFQEDYPQAVEVTLKEIIARPNPSWILHMTLSSKTIRAAGSQTKNFQKTDGK